MTNNLISRFLLIFFGVTIFISSCSSEPKIKMDLPVYTFDQKLSDVLDSILISEEKCSYWKDKDNWFVIDLDSVKDDYLMAISLIFSETYDFSDSDGYFSYKANQFVIEGDIIDILLEKTDKSKRIKFKESNKDIMLFNDDRYSAYYYKYVDGKYINRGNYICPN